MNVKPLSDRIVVKPEAAEEKTASGIILPDTAQEKPQMGTVMAVGPGKSSDSGDLIKTNIILFNNYFPQYLYFFMKWQNSNTNLLLTPQTFINIRLMTNLMMIMTTIISRQGQFIIIGKYLSKVENHQNGFRA